MNKKLYLGFIVMAFIFSGCSNAPGVKEIEVAVTEEKQACFELKLIKATLFEKINGIASGEQNYTVEYKYQAELLDSGYAIEELKKEGMSELGAKDVAWSAQMGCISLTPIDIATRIANKEKALSAGDQFEITGSMMFVKSEKGWVRKR